MWSTCSRDKCTTNSRTVSTLELIFIKLTTLYLLHFLCPHTHTHTMQLLNHPAWTLLLIEEQSKVVNGYVPMWGALPMGKAVLDLP